jgi:predicted DNA-binding transcriptional regulator AlpA
MSMIQMPELCERFGISKATVMRQINRGTLPRGVKMGDRELAWPMREIDAIELARIALWPDSKLMMLVNRLMDRRELEAVAIVKELTDWKL